MRLCTNTFAFIEPCTPKDEGAHHAERRGLGRGGHAHVDRAQDQRDQRHHGDEVTGGVDFLAEGHLAIRRGIFPGLSSAHTIV
jgi:hypothetical protein